MLILIALRVIRVWFIKTYIRLQIRIEIGLEFNQSKKRKPIIKFSLNFASIDQVPIQSQF